MRLSLANFIIIISTAIFFPGIANTQKQNNNINEEIQDGSKRTIQDTSKVINLFEQGYRFTDGPSDSLLYYFDSALKIINTNLSVLEKDESSDKNLVYVYRKLKVRTLIEFGIEYFYQNEYASALKYYNDALEIARLTGNTELISECVSEIGIVYKNQGDYERALAYYNQALELAKQTTDIGWVASCQVNIGNVYKEKGFLNIAQKYYLDALKIMESLDESRRIAACYQNIGDIYNKQRDFEKSLEYFSKALELAKAENDKVREISIYLNSGDVYIKTGQYQTARDFLEKAIFLYNETGYELERDNCYILMGKSWFEEKDYKQAIVYFEKALEIAQLKNDKARTAEIEGNLGSVYFQLKNYTKALELFKNSLQTAESVGLLELAISAKLNLSNLYEILGQYQLSIQNYKDYSQLKDSLFNAEKYKVIKEMEVKYESEKKQQQLNLLSEKNEIQQLKLSRRNRMMFFLIAGIVLLILIGYLLRSQNILKLRQKEIELEQRLLRSQMNPHFIFNSLIAIQSYIYKKEPIVAGDYLARFAELVRLILENSRVEFVTLKKEVEAIKVYMELQELRFENKFDYLIDLANEIDPENTVVPPMFAQPFIENAIEHGLRHLTKKGHIHIFYAVKNEESLEITIEDNGVGREKAGEIKKKKQHQSLALNITKERLQALSKKYKNKFNLEIIDLTDNKNNPAGTKIRIVIPFKIT